MSFEPDALRRGTREVRCVRCVRCVRRVRCTVEKVIAIMLDLHEDAILVIEDEVSSRQQASDHARCGIWNTLFSQMDVMRKAQDKK